MCQSYWSTLTDRGNLRACGIMKLRTFSLRTWPLSQWETMPCLFRTPTGSTCRAYFRVQVLVYVLDCPDFLAARRSLYEQVLSFLSFGLFVLLNQLCSSSYFVTGYGSPPFSLSFTHRGSGISLKSFFYFKLHSFSSLFISSKHQHGP